MKKIALLLALLMLLCCAGCGEKEAAEGQQAATGAAQQETTTAQPGEEAEEAPCAESEDGKHQYEEELVAEATCTVPGVMMYTCIACQYSKTSEIPAPGHAGTGASCEEPSICTICGDVAEEAWGHVDESGVCRNCGFFMSEITMPTQSAAPEATVAEEVESTEEATEATEAVTE